MVTTPLDSVPTTDTDVLVVGAGPTGLMTALVLARRGVPVTVVDGKSGPTRESRAIVVHPRSMELYAQLGLAEQVRSQSWTAATISPGRDTALATIDLGRWQTGDTPYPGAHIFEQSRNEEMIVAALQDAGVTILWGHRLVDLTQDDAGVDALLSSDTDLTRVRARWCVGADGARSRVRRLLDVAFEGITDDAMFWVADVHGLTGLASDGIAIRFGPRTFVLAFPLGEGGHVRLIGLVDGDAAVQDTVLPGAAREFGVTWSNVAWFSSYRVHHRVAAAFRRGRVFLAGDAAHVHSPVGGQGMNTGLQDGHHLANVLADVALGHRDEAALESYEAERRPVARTLVRVTDRAFGVIGRRGRLWAVARRTVVGVVAVAVPRLDRAGLGPYLAGLIGQYRIHYHLVPRAGATPAWAQDDVVGRRLPPVDDAANHAALQAMTWQLHAYGRSPVRPDLPGFVEGPLIFPADPSGRLRSDRLYLIRPDGFVAASLPLVAGHADGAATAQAAEAARLITR